LQLCYEVANLLFGLAPFFEWMLLLAPFFGKLMSSCCSNNLNWLETYWLWLGATSSLLAGWFSTSASQPIHLYRTGWKNKNTRTQ
jgi:hypothetical protein